jgi:hypothetical protein
LSRKQAAKITVVSFPVYQVQAHHTAARIQHFRWFRGFERDGLYVLGNLFLKEEAWFHLNRYINSQNSRTWSAENLHALHKSPLPSSKTGALCAVSRKQTVCSTCFEEKITAENYQNF